MYTMYISLRVEIYAARPITESVDSMLCNWMPSRCFATHSLTLPHPLRTFSFDFVCLARWRAVLYLTVLLVTPNAKVSNALHSLRLMGGVLHVLCSQYLEPFWCLTELDSINNNTTYCIAPDSGASTIIMNCYRRSASKIANC